jgi:hypothetical protein
VEAFPGAFLGVLMPEAGNAVGTEAQARTGVLTGFAKGCNDGKFESLLSKTLDLPDVVWHRLRSETNHELRAALICLLTATLADNGTAAIIGEAEGGWFWLPPRSLWQP